jgi:hypothetical protein
LRDTRPAARYAEACLTRLASAPIGQGRQRCLSVALALYARAQARLLDPVAVTARIKGVMRARGWIEGNPDGATPEQLDRLLCWAWEHARDA